jgi:hypothetical protein
MTTTLHRISPSNAETAEYEGTYRGVAVRVTRITDPNADGGTPETRWDGFIQETIFDRVQGRERPNWSPVAECYGSRKSVLAECERWIDRTL